MVLARWKNTFISKMVLTRFLPLDLTKYLYYRFEKSKNTQHSLRPSNFFLFYMMHSRRWKTIYITCAVPCLVLDMYLLALVKSRISRRKSLHNLCIIRAFHDPKNIVAMIKSHVITPLLYLFFETVD